MKTTLWVLLFSLLTFSVAGFDIVRNGKAEAYIVTQKTFSPETAKAVKAFTENIFLATIFGAFLYGIGISALGAGIDNVSVTLGRGKGIIHDIINEIY